MPFTNKVVKKDLSGTTPIPQYFNKSIDDYEPQNGENGEAFVKDKDLLSKVTDLDTKNIQIASALSVTVAAGATTDVIPEQDMLLYPKFYIMVWSSVSHEYSVLIRRRDEGMSAAFSDNEEIFFSNGGYAGSTPIIETRAAKLLTKIKNNSTVSQTYKVVLMGVK